MALRESKYGTWRVYWYDTGRRGRVKSFKSHAEAQAFHDEIYPPVVAGPPRPVCPLGTTVLQVGGHRARSPIVGWCLVDEADYETVGRFRWSAHTGGYIVRRQRVGNRNAVVYLHRLLLGLTDGDGLEVDHINGDKLDNRRANLRVVSHDANQQNMVSHHDASSSYRGVDWLAARGRWRARVKAGGREHHLGLFDTELEAAEAARRFRVEHLPYTVEGRGGSRCPEVMSSPSRSTA